MKLALIIKNESLGSVVHSIAGRPVSFHVIYRAPASQGCQGSILDMLKLFTLRLYCAVNGMGD